MAITTRQSVTGLRELGAALKAMGDEVALRLAKRATNAAAKVVKVSARSKALQQPTLADKPYTIDGVVYVPGHVARNIIEKHINEPGLTSATIVAVRSNKANGYAGRIASLNEFGTVKMAAQPFMRPGFEASKDAALSKIVSTLRTGIEAQARKSRKK